METEQLNARIDGLTADIVQQLEFVKGLENRTPNRPLLENAEEYLRRALIALEEAWA